MVSPSAMPTTLADQAQERQGKDRRSIRVRGTNQTCFFTAKTSYLQVLFLHKKDQSKITSNTGAII
jgi:hypothetical protein